MANPFGEVVDNDKLEEMERYIDKPKTQEDRAREAYNLKNDDGKNKKAEQYVDSVKADYGDGASTLCLIYNATGETLHYVNYHDWSGFIGRTPYPTVIGNGQWAAFLHVHTSGSSSGSEAAVVYRGKNKDGQDRDFMLAWSTPWGPWYKNKAYCEMNEVDAFGTIRNWNDMYDYLRDSGYSDHVDRDGIKIEVDTATGSSPYFYATIRIPFDP